MLHDGHSVAGIAAARRSISSGWAAGGRGVREVVAKRSRSMIRRRVSMTVNYAVAGPVVAKLPDGLRSLLARVFRGAIELSGGEWQKVGLARTHWRSSTSRADGILIVDEPTSALDPEAEIEAFDRIRRLAAPNRAVVLVTHRMSGVRRADHIYVLDNGHLAEHGTHDELVAARGRYAAMFDAQAAQYAPAPNIPNPAAPTVPDQV